MRELCLVACVARKLARAAPAMDLYDSAWFHKARSFVEQRRSRWMILSAKHGLLAPDTVIAPYEVTLMRMARRERLAWAHRVLEDLTPLASRASTVIVLAGARYREFILPALRARGIQVEIPLERLGIGEQLAWLNKHTARLAASS